MCAFLGKFRAYFLAAAAFSPIINLLMLVPALRMLQVCERVISSCSLTTLVILFTLTMAALIVMANLSAIREPKYVPTWSGRRRGPSSGL